MAPNILKKSILNFKNITKGMFSLNEGLGRSQKYTANINKDILKSSERKKNYLRESSFSFKRKIESSRRRKSEGIIELSKVGAVFRAPSRVIADTTQGFFSRILNFAGTIMAGWMIYNLPSIIGMAQELGSRAIRFTQILQSFTPNVLSILGSFGDLLGSYVRNFISFDFKDSNNRVENSMKNLNNALSGLQGSFDEVIQLFTTPLTKGLGGRQDSPELGTDYTDQKSRSGGGGGGGRWKPLLDVISSGEGGYESVNPGQVVPGLTEMTIAQAWETAKRVGKSKGGSGAMGRYQLLSDPIGRAKNAGLDPYKDKFSPENQDKIAVYIIENIRYGKDWLSGKLGDSDFAQGLANEWAGVPNLSGRYSYKGQGGKVKASSVKAALEQVKKGSSQTQPSPLTPTVTPQTPLSTNFSSIRGTSGTVKYGGRESAELSVPYSPFKSGSGAVITSGMGFRRSTNSYHKGYDLAASAGTPLYSYFPGKVTHIGLDGTSSSAGYGNWVVWKDDMYGAYHFFGHMVNKPPVRVGQIVSQGTLMGNVGSTGRSGGPHLHWEISNSPPQPNGQFTSLEDPGSWLKNHPLKKIEGQPQNPQISPPTPSGSPSSQKPKPAQISPLPKDQPSEKLIPEQTADSYVVPFLYPQPQVQPSGAVMSGGKENIPYGDNTLNRFITKKLLLDLAYT
jgi:murein DD-endopeptidase MepM/ murein hydrolase activator NlpD